MSQKNTETSIDTFYECIQQNDFKLLKVILKNKDLSISEDDNYALFQAVEVGKYNIVELLLEDKRINPAHAFNRCITFAAKNGHVKVVELLLKDKRVNPADYCNNAIINSYINHNYNYITHLLWNDLRVKNSLEKDDLLLYNELTKKDIKSKLSEF